MYCTVVICFVLLLFCCTVVICVVLLLFVLFYFYLCCSVVIVLYCCYLCCSVIIYVVLCIVCVKICTVPLPTGVHPIAVDIYIKYQIICINDARPNINQIY